MVLVNRRGNGDRKPGAEEDSLGPPMRRRCLFSSVASCQRLLVAGRRPSGKNEILPSAPSKFLRGLLSGKILQWQAGFPSFMCVAAAACLRLVQDEAILQKKYCSPRSYSDPHPHSVHFPRSWEHCIRIDAVIGDKSVPHILKKLQLSVCQVSSTKRHM